MKNFLPTDAKVAKALGLSRTWRKSINTSEVIASLEEIVENEIAKVENGKTLDNWSNEGAIIDGLTLCINTESTKKANLLSLDASLESITMSRKVFNMLKALNDSENKEDNDFATYALALSFCINNFNDVARYILRNSLHDKTVNAESDYVYMNNKDIYFRCANWGSKLWELVEYVENNDETATKKDIEKTNSATVSIETLKTAVRVSAQYLAAVASESHTEGENEEIEEAAELIQEVDGDTFTAYEFAKVFQLKKENESNEESSEWAKNFDTFKAWEAISYAIDFQSIKFEDAKAYEKNKRNNPKFDKISAALVSSGIKISLEDVDTSDVSSDDMEIFGFQQLILHIESSFKVDNFNTFRKIFAGAGMKSVALLIKSYKVEKNSSKKAEVAPKVYMEETKEEKSQQFHDEKKAPTLENNTKKSKKYDFAQLHEGKTLREAISEERENFGKVDPERFGKILRLGNSWETKMTSAKAIEIIEKATNSLKRLENLTSSERVVFFSSIILAINEQEGKYSRYFNNGEDKNSNFFGASKEFTSQLKKNLASGNENNKVARCLASVLDIAGFRNAADAILMVNISNNVDTVEELSSSDDNKSFWIERKALRIYEKKEKGLKQEEKNEAEHERKRQLNRSWLLDYYKGDKSKTKEAQQIGTLGVSRMDNTETISVNIVPRTVNFSTMEKLTSKQIGENIHKRFAILFASFCTNETKKPNAGELNQLRSMLKNIEEAAKERECFSTWQGKRLLWCIIQAQRDESPKELQESARCAEIQIYKRNSMSGMSRDERTEKFWDYCSTALITLDKITQGSIAGLELPDEIYLDN